MNMGACCCLALDPSLDSPSRTPKFGIECIAKRGTIEQNVLYLVFVYKSAVNYFCGAVEDFCQ